MRYLPSAALWLAITGTGLPSQIPAGEGGRQQPLPLTDAETGNGEPAVTTIREIDTLARVADGETLVELVIMLTPRIVRPVGAQ